MSTSRTVFGFFATTVVVLAFTAPPALAQGERRGHIQHHDSSNLPPGHDNGKGKGHDNPFSFTQGAVLSNGPVTVAASLAAATIGTSLRGGTYAPEGTRLSTDMQALLLSLLQDSNGDAASSLALSLIGPDNAVASAEAADLADALGGLLDAPETLPHAVLGFNALIDRSSLDFLRSPPEEFHAVRVVLASMLEPTLRAIEEELGDGSH